MADDVDFEAVFNAGGTATVLLSRDFAIVAVNDAYVTVSGRARSELVGRDLFEAFPDDPEAARALRSSLDRVLATGERHVMALLRYDVSVPGRAGEIEQRYWSPVNVPVFDDDHNVRLILHRVEEVTEYVRELGLPRDVTVELQAAQAEVYARSRELESTNQRLAAATDITMALLADEARGDVLELIAQRARQIAGADHGFVLLLEDGRFVVAAGAGETAVGVTALAAEVLRSVRAQVGVAGVAVPLIYDEEARGVLAVANAPGVPRISSTTVQLLEPFAAQAALALELGDRRRDRARLLMLEDRDRIARDLQRSVVSRLFELGLELTFAADLVARDEPARRVRGVVTALDGVVQDLQAVVFGTTGARPAGGTFRARVRDLLDHAAESQGFATTSHLDHRLDGAIEERAEQHLIAVLSELLVGDVREPGAHVSVSLGLYPEPEPDCVLGEVEIAGIGLPTGIAELALAGLARRAAQLGGSLTMADADGGRRFTWRMPLRGPGPSSAHRHPGS